MPPTSTRRKLKAVVGSSGQNHVAFCGPIGVGKTTAVRAASSIPVSGSEAHSTILAGSGRNPDKRTTTVAIEYGEWHRDGAPAVAIYGTPGQARFVEARSGALNARAATVLWLFGQNDYALAEAEEWLEFIGRTTEWRRLTVVVTRLDEPGDHPSLEDYRPMLDRYYKGIPLLAADPRRTADVRRAIAVALDTVKEDS